MPDATLTYMNHHGPRIVLLDRSTTCTNTLHRLWFDPKSTVMPELIALSFLTSFSQLSAEREGRFYGGGILKLEPKGARRIRLVIPKEIPKAELAAAFAAADSALRDGRLDQAMKIADETILRPILGRSFSDTRAEVVRQLAAARHLRHGR